MNLCVGGEEGKGLSGMTCGWNRSEPTADLPRLVPGPVSLLLKQPERSQLWTRPATWASVLKESSGLGRVLRGSLQGRRGFCWKTP